MFQEENKKSLVQENEISEIDIREVRDEDGKVKYHTLYEAEYMETEFDEETQGVFEALYNGGKIKAGIVSTGRWWSVNGDVMKYTDFRHDTKVNKQGYKGKHCPEFEYQGLRGARVITHLKNKCNKMYKGLYRLEFFLYVSKKLEKTYIILA